MSDFPYPYDVKNLPPFPPLGMRRFPNDLWPLPAVLGGLGIAFVLGDRLCNDECVTAPGGCLCECPIHSSRTLGVHLHGGDTRASGALGDLRRFGPREYTRAAPAGDAGRLSTDGGLAVGRIHRRLDSREQ